MEIKRVSLARFLDFDVATGCQIFPKILFLLTNSYKIIFGNYLPHFYIFFHFLLNNCHNGNFYLPFFQFMYDLNLVDMRR